MNECAPLQTALSAAWAEAGAGPLIVGLSGGGDSLALLHLLRAHAPGRRLIAVIVDHGMRPESAQEAALAAARAQAVGVEARVELLEWAPGEARHQEGLRAARHRRLAVTARALGARAIALGHTLDDQAETVLMRWTRSAGPDVFAAAARPDGLVRHAEAARAEGLPWRGLAGIAARAPAPIWPEGLGLVLVRPLLGQRRAALRAYLAERGAEWIDDPSNENPRFERIAMRKALAARAGIDSAALGAVAAALRALAREEDRAAAAWLGAHVCCEGSRALLWPGNERAPVSVRLRGLGALLAAIAGAQRPPAAGALAAVLADLSGPRSAAFKGRTLGGARLQPHAGGVLIRRDPGAILGRAGAPAAAAAPLSAGRPRVWDGRLCVTALCEGLSIAPDPADSDGALIRAAAGGSALALDAACAAGRIRAHWLIEARLSHILFTQL